MLLSDALVEAEQRQLLVRPFAARRAALGSPLSACARRPPPRAQVIQCKHCRNVVGDTFSLRLIHRELQFVCIGGAWRRADGTALPTACSPAG